MNWKNLGPLIVFTIGLLLCAVVAFGQTVQQMPYSYDPYSITTLTKRPAVRHCTWLDVDCWSKLSPVTKEKLYSHDPNVCHCAECRRARLAAGIEYMGIDKPVYTPMKHWQYCWGEGVVFVAKCKGGKGGKK